MPRFAASSAGRNLGLLLFFWRMLPTEWGRLDMRDKVFLIEGWKHYQEYRGKYLKKRVYVE